MTDALPSGPTTEPRSRSSRRRGSTRLGTSLRWSSCRSSRSRWWSRSWWARCSTRSSNRSRTSFQNVQYCVDHPKDPARDLRVAPSQ